MINKQVERLKKESMKTEGMELLATEELKSVKGGYWILVDGKWVWYNGGVPEKKEKK